MIIKLILLQSIIILKSTIISMQSLLVDTFISTNYLMIMYLSMSFNYLFFYEGLWSGLDCSKCWIMAVDCEFRPPTLKGMAVVYITYEHLLRGFVSAVLNKNWKAWKCKTRKHGIACGNVVVEEVEKKQCCKCKGLKGLEMFGGDDATCS